MSAATDKYYNVVPRAVNTATRYLKYHKRFRVDSSCMTRYIKPYSIIDYIACGDYGCVFQVCVATGRCNYVIKVFIGDDSEEDINVVEIGREITLSKTLGAAGVSPKVVDSWTCKGKVFMQLRGRIFDQDLTIGFIVMDRMQLSLRKYSIMYPTEYKLNKSNIIRTIETHLSTMAKLTGKIHRDLSCNNVMVNLDHNHDIIDLKLIDFGLIQEFEDQDLRAIATDVFNTCSDATEPPDVEDIPDELIEGDYM